MTKCVYAVSFHLVNDAVPSVAGIVDDDVQFTFAEFCSFLDECVEVDVVQHVSRHGEGFAAVLVDGVGNLACFS